MVFPFFVYLVYFNDMKIKLMCLILFSFNICLSQSNPKNIILNNNIAKVRVFDNNGNIVSVVHYDIYGNVVYKYLKKFEGVVFSSIIKTYDDSGNNIKTYFEDSGETWFFEFDDNNNEVLIKDNDGCPIFQYFYDDSNFLVKTVAFKEGSDKIRRVEISEKFDSGKKIVTTAGKRVNTKYFDEKGNNVKSDSYDGDVLNSLIESVYDENNRLIEVRYGFDGGVKYYYNSNHQLVKMQVFNLDKDVEYLDSKIEEFEYFENGLLKKYCENRYSDKMREFTYEYDFREISQ